MADDKTHVSMADVHWEDLPQKTKTLVYEHLRATIAQFDRDIAMSELLQDVAGPSTPMPPLAAAQKAASMAFFIALATLEDCDGELCLDCGTYHDDEMPHPTNPKDLS